MTNLITVDTENSRATIFKRLFGGCTRLASVDVSHFDTANSTSMNGMFSTVQN